MLSIVLGRYISTLYMGIIIDTKFSFISLYLITFFTIAVIFAISTLRSFFVTPKKETDRSTEKIEMLITQINPHKLLFTYWKTKSGGIHDTVVVIMAGIIADLTK